MSADKGTMREAGGRDAPVEQAGETTAAEMVSGPENTKPVGADTMVNVSDAPEGEEKGGAE